MLKQITLSKDKKRTGISFILVLPYQKDPNSKLNIWQILKDVIGKDISNFSVPVQLNEPISML